MSTEETSREPKNFYLKEVKFDCRPGTDIYEQITGLLEWAFKNLKPGESTTTELNGIHVTLEKKFR